MDVGLVEAAYGTGQYRATTNPLQLHYVVEAKPFHPLSLRIWTPSGVEDGAYAEWYGHETPRSTILWWSDTFNIARIMSPGFRTGQARISLSQNKIFFVLSVFDDKDVHASKVRIVSNWEVSSQAFSNSRVYQEGPEVPQEERKQDEHPSRFERDIEGGEPRAVPR